MLYTIYCHFWWSSQCQCTDDTWMAPFSTIPISSRNKIQCPKISCYSQNAFPWLQSRFVVYLTKCSFHSVNLKHEVPSWRNSSKCALLAPDRTLSYWELSNLSQQSQNHREMRTAGRSFSCWHSFKVYQYLKEIAERASIAAYHWKTNIIFLYLFPFLVFLNRL